MWVYLHKTPSWVKRKCKHFKASNITAVMPYINAISLEFFPSKNRTQTNKTLQNCSNISVLPVMHYNISQVLSVHKEMLAECKARMDEILQVLYAWSLKTFKIYPWSQETQQTTMLFMRSFIFSSRAAYVVFTDFGFSSSSQISICIVCTCNMDNGSHLQYLQT